MNILFVLQRYPGFGGIESVTKMLAGEFIVSYGYNVTVFSTSRQEVASQILDHDKFRYTTSDLKGSELKAYFDTVVADVKPDFIIYQDSYVPEEFLLEGIDKSIKVIVCEHNSPDCLETGLDFVTKNLSNANPANIIRKLRLPFRKKKLHRTVKLHHLRMLELCDCYLLLSNSFFPILKECYQVEDDKISTMPNPIVIPDTVVDINRERRNRVLFVGRLTAQKGVNYLLDIWSRIEPRCDWELVVVGDGDQREYMENEINARHLSRINLVGFQENVYSYLIDSKVFFSPSVFEGFGIAILEALAAGTIPIAFDSYASVRDLITDGENGYLIPPFEVQEFADRFISFTRLSDSMVKEMREKACKKAMEFELSVIAEKWKNLMEGMKS